MSVKSQFALNLNEEFPNLTNSPVLETDTALNNFGS